MTFLHNNCVFDIWSLEYKNNKSEFLKKWRFSWKIKPYSILDKALNLDWVKSSVFRITYRGNLKIKPNDRIDILGWVFKWKYSVKDVNNYEWIIIKTTKIIITKIEND